eukprot:12432408-Alexandrium_andersonii.AAC.1
MGNACQTEDDRAMLIPQPLTSGTVATKLETSYDRQVPRPRAAEPITHTREKQALGRLTTAQTAAPPARLHR